MVFVTNRLKLVTYALSVGLLSVLALPEQALAKKKPRDHSHLAFDADKRKKTKSSIGQRLSYSGSIGLSRLDEHNQKLNDGVDDRSLQIIGTLSFAFKAQISEKIRGFAHVELSQTDKTTHRQNYGSYSRVKIKEAHLSFELADKHTLSFGRMRFAEPRRWGMDASVDGIHLGWKDDKIAWETALFRDAFDGRGTYAFLHAQRFSERSTSGTYALFESYREQQRLHVAGYFATRDKKRGGFNLYAAGVFGDAANQRPFGFAIDANLVSRFSDVRWKPQLVLGLAAGSPGYMQPDLNSNKARDGGQTQFHRFGTVFQPDLSNLLVATAAVGLRPSRSFSVDLRAHAYAQMQKSTVAPVARVQGMTTGASRHVGHEVSIVSAWRPNKSTKVEFSAGVFKPGRAYSDRSTVKRLYLRMTKYF
ncbi:alginate export family protein [Sulfitobacter mediterraneus]|uniref:Alginate export domain-containing protein n=1 Tax=Sulfitobacter mediterraneus TaxID=83219 RepID=A0A061SUJ1_9RHOB|nr:alginate export family protein [Sulfitobacter mediterraneus]KAJ04627.1 hypothetical protein PM02_02165 [Sulfitobacter mediterraneus]